jgi:hypothetical protein
VAENEHGREKQDPEQRRLHQNEKSGVAGWDMGNNTTYKVRFENLFRLALKVTSSLNIGDILEFIRDEAKEIVPNAREACLLMFDPEAEHYTRPLHCAVYKNRINCQLCKRGRKTILGAIDRPLSFPFPNLPEDAGGAQSDKPDNAMYEIALPVSDGNQALAGPGRAECYRAGRSSS